MSHSTSQNFIPATPEIVHQSYSDRVVSVVYDVGRGHDTKRYVLEVHDIVVNDKDFSGDVCFRHAGLFGRLLTPSCHSGNVMMILRDHPEVLRATLGKGSNNPHLTDENLIIIGRPIIFNLEQRLPGWRPEYYHAIRKNPSR